MQSYYHRCISNDISTNFCGDLDFKKAVVVVVVRPNLLTNSLMVRLSVLRLFSVQKLKLKCKYLNRLYLIVKRGYSTILATRSQLLSSFK